ncbi:DUF6223 family protein [Streptomyces sp. NPDC006365]|uniref:DUF6223 family protein n=1 Tax=Streptomyces sp. NPDC006365 TaxID=3364744 RepID=UPI00368457C6
MNSSGSVRWSVRRVPAMAGAALLGVVLLAAPAAAHASVQPTAASVTDMSAGRLGAGVAGVLGLIGAVIGGLALARPAGRFGAGSGRLGTIVPLAAGLTAMALGALVVATSDGGIGTGNGLGGAIVALVAGLIAVVLGGLALARFRRTGPAPAVPAHRP